MNPTVEKLFKLQVIGPEKIAEIRNRLIAQANAIAALEQELRYKNRRIIDLEEQIDKAYKVCKALHSILDMDSPPPGGV